MKFLPVIFTLFLLLVHGSDEDNNSNKDFHIDMKNLEDALQKTLTELEMTDKKKTYDGTHIEEIEVDLNENKNEQIDEIFNTVMNNLKPVKKHAIDVIDTEEEDKSYITDKFENSLNYNYKPMMKIEKMKEDAPISRLHEIPDWAGEWPPKDDDITKDYVLIDKASAHKEFAENVGKVYIERGNVPRIFPVLTTHNYEEKNMKHTIVELTEDQAIYLYMMSDVKTKQEKVVDDSKKEKKEGDDKTNEVKEEESEKDKKKDDKNKKKVEEEPQKEKFDFNTLFFKSYFEEAEEWGNDQDQSSQYNYCLEKKQKKFQEINNELYQPFEYTKHLSEFVDETPDQYTERTKKNEERKKIYKEKQDIQEEYEGKYLEACNNIRNAKYVMVEKISAPYFRFVAEFVEIEKGIPIIDLSIYVPHGPQDVQNKQIVFGTAFARAQAHRQKINQIWDIRKGEKAHGKDVGILLEAANRLGFDFLARLCGARIGLEIGVSIENGYFEELADIKLHDDGEKRLIDLVFNL